MERNKQNAQGYIIGIVQEWFAKGGVVTFPDGTSIHATDVNQTVLVPNDDGSVLGNLTINGK